MEYNNREYEERVVLFLDFLGFQSHIDEIKDNQKEIDKLYNILDGLHDYVTKTFEQSNYENVMTTNAYIVKTPIQVTHFSDSIVISFLYKKHNALERLLQTIQSLIIHLINNGIICRGAISYGKLIHDNNVIFGKALNDAYETEQKAAIYPRVVLDKSILTSEQINKSMSSRREKELLAYLIKDTDEKYYINYFLSGINNYCMLGIDNPQTYLTKLRQIIDKNKSKQEPSLKIKYGWMINKYNRMLKEIKDKKNPYSISQIQESAEFIENLKEI